MINLDTLALITACLFYHNFSTRKLIQHFLFFDIDVFISIVTIARIGEYKEVCLFAQSATNLPFLFEILTIEISFPTMAQLSAHAINRNWSQRIYCVECIVMTHKWEKNL